MHGDMTDDEVLNTLVFHRRHTYRHREVSQHLPLLRLEMLRCIPNTGGHLSQARVGHGLRTDVCGPREWGTVEDLSPTERERLAVLIVLAPPSGWVWGEHASVVPGIGMVVPFWNSSTSYPIYYVVRDGEVYDVV